MREGVELLQSTLQCPKEYSWMNRSWLLLLGVMLLLAACSGASTPQQVTVIASDFQYEPSTIEVIAGQTVHLTSRTPAPSITTSAFWRSRSWRGKYRLPGRRHILA